MAQEEFSHNETTVNGIKLHYVREGRGAPLLLIHGWPGFWYEWHLNIKPLAEQFDVIVPDMRGYAYSEKPDLPPEQGYTDTVFAEDIRALIDGFGFDKVNIVSHDFGAAWVQRFAVLYPERLEKLMLFDPPYGGIGPRWFQIPNVFNAWYQFFHQQPWAEDLVGSSREATRIYISHFLSAWSADKDLWTEEEIEAYTDAFSQTGALRGGFNCYRAVYRGANKGLEGKTIDTPTTILWGDGDSILPFEWSDNLGQTFSNFTLKKIEGAGHFMMREKPDRINSEIAGFMKQG